MDSIKLSIIIVSFNTKEILKNCINTVIRNSRNINYEIIVIDNASEDGSLDLLNSISKKHPLKIIVNRKNLGFGHANNQGMKVAKGNYLLLLNSDTIIKDNLFPEIIKWMDENPKVGLCSCSLKNKDGSLQGTGGHFPTLIRVISWMTIQDIPLVDAIIKPFHPMKTKSFYKGNKFYKNEKELDWVTGAFFLLRHKTALEVGYFDEDYFMYTEEVDYCYRLKELGWKVYFLPKWEIIHLGGASGKGSSYVIDEYKGVKLFYKKHYPKWQYPILRLFLKIGALGRIILYGLLEGADSAKVYAKAFEEA